METKKGVARGPSVPGLEARMCPACCREPTRASRVGGIFNPGRFCSQGALGDVWGPRHGRDWEMPLRQVGRGWGCCSAPYRARDGPATKNYPPRVNDAQADKPRLGDEGAERNRMHFKFLGATFEKGKKTGEINFDTILYLIVSTGSQ